MACDEIICQIPNRAGDKDEYPQERPGEPQTAKNVQCGRGFGKEGSTFNQQECFIFVCLKVKVLENPLCGRRLQSAEFKGPCLIPVQDKIDKRIAKIADPIKYDKVFESVPFVRRKRYALFHDCLR